MMRTIYFLYFFGLLLLHSCSLERVPLDQFSENTFWNSEENVEIALAGVYRSNLTYNQTESASDWWSYAGLIFLEFATDNAYDRRGINSSFHRLTNGTLLSTNPYIKLYWKSSYIKIGRCNQFLKGLDKLKNVDEKKIDRYRAEARFLRATQYFYLSQYFYDVPLVTSVLSLDEANNVVKTPRKEIVDFVINELKESVESLPRFSELEQEEKGRASKQAALAFLGRTYLGEHMYNEAAEIYKQIIDYGDNIIDDDYASLFTPQNEDSSENIFSTQYIEDLAGSGLPQHAYPAKDGGWCIVNPLGSLFEAYQFTDGTDFSYESPLYDPKDLGKNRDPRLKATLLYDGSVFKGTKYITHPDSISSDRIMGGQTTQTGFLLRKYLDDSFAGVLYSYGGDIPIIRYSEILLSYLEAKLEAGDIIDQNLLDETINKVRGRASVNMPPIKELNPAKLRQILRNERRVELALEGIRLWDLMRWHIAHEVLNGDVFGAPYPGSIRKSPNSSGEVDKYGRWYVASRAFRENVDYRWPIPQSEQDINPNLR